MKHIEAQYPALRTSRVQIVGIVGAGLLVLMLVAQLYSYENLASILSVVLPYGDQTLITVTAALIVIAELFTLPWLLGMKLSHLFRALSAVIGLAIGSFWLMVALTNAHAINSGLLGEKVVIPGGLLALGWALALLSCLLCVFFYDTRLRTS